MNSTVKKHSILIGNRTTSISLDDVFWTSLQQIARGRQVRRSDLVASLDTVRKNTNLSSAIRVFILDHYRAMAVAKPQRDLGARAILESRKSEKIESRHHHLQKSLNGAALNYV